MKRLIICVLLLIPIVVFGQAKTSAYIVPICEDGVGGDCFDVVITLINLGDATTDSCVDMDNDGVIDVRRLVNSWTSGQNDGLFLKYYATGDSLGWTTAGGSGMPAADFNDSLESQVEFSPKLHAKLDSSTAVRGAIDDSLQTNWATFVSDDNDTVTAYRAAIHDSLDANWATFILDNNDTVTAYRAAIHDSLDANWSLFVADENDTVTVYRAAIHDSLVANWATWIQDSEIHDSIDNHYKTAGWGISFNADSVWADSNDLDDVFAKSAASGMPPGDFDDSLESQIEFSPNTYEKIDSTSAKIPTAEVADSANGGAIRAETAKYLASEYLTLSTVYGASSINRSDSLRLTLPCMEAMIPVLFIDSSYVAGADDSVIVTGQIPTDCDIDSLIFTYKVSDGVSGLIDSLSIIGPDRSNNLNICDSVYQTLTTDRTATSATRLGLNLTDIAVNGGEYFGVVFHTKLDANDYVKVYYVQLFLKQ